jgi:hypothetical protein
VPLPESPNPYHAGLPSQVRTVDAVVFDRDMAIVLGKLGVDGLSETVGVLRELQYVGAPMQLHPGRPGLVLAVRCSGEGRRRPDLEPGRTHSRAALAHAVW